MTKARDNASQGGLVLLTPGSATNGTVGSSGGVTFTGVASITVNNVFSSAYDNYKLVFYINSATASGNVTLQLTSGGTATTTTCKNITIGINEANSTVTYTGNSTSANLGYVASGSVAEYQIAVDILQPFLTEYKTLTGGGTSINSAINNVVGQIYNANFRFATSHDGFKVNMPANCTGKLFVYGYRK